MTQLRRKHLAPGTYFVWRCRHKDGMQDRVSDRNDGPQQGDCEVELVDAPDYAHVRTVAHVELAEVMSRLETFKDEIGTHLQHIVMDLRVANQVAVQHRNAGDNAIYSDAPGLRSGLALEHEQLKRKVLGIAKQLRARSYEKRDELTIVDRMLFEQLRQALDAYEGQEPRQPDRPGEGAPGNTPA